MKYKIGDKVFHKDNWHSNCNGHMVVDAKSSAGMYDQPQYKVETKETKSGYVWLREWMLK